LVADRSDRAEVIEAVVLHLGRCCDDAQGEWTASVHAAGVDEVHVLRAARGGRALVKAVARGAQPDVDSSAGTGASILNDAVAVGAIDELDVATRSVDLLRLVDRVVLDGPATPARHVSVAVVGELALAGQGADRVWARWACAGGARAGDAPGVVAIRLAALL